MYLFAVENIVNTLQYEVEHARVVNDVQVFLNQLEVGDIVYETNPGDVFSWVILKTYYGPFLHCNLVVKDPNGRLCFLHFTGEETIHQEKLYHNKRGWLDPVLEDIERSVFPRFQSKQTVVRIWRPSLWAIDNKKVVIQDVTKLQAEVTEMCKNKNNQIGGSFYHCNTFLMEYLFFQQGQSYRVWQDWWLSRPSSFGRMLLKGGYAPLHYTFQVLKKD